MRLATFTDDKSTRIGVVRDDHVVDLSVAAPGTPTEMRAFLAAGPEAMEAARSAAANARNSIALSDVRLEAPVMQPRKFMALALNYFLREPLPNMTAEAFEDLRRQQQSTKAKNWQSWYNKQVTCINGPFDPIRLPSAAGEVCFEVELAFVIGERCRNVAKEDASRVIAGFMVCNDVTCPKWCQASPTLTLGKSSDTFGPIGPWLVTADEVGDPHDLELSGYVNGEKRHTGNTRDMIFNCWELVEFASGRFTLEPGDVVTTGMPYVPLLGMEPGDLVRCQVERVGYIENRIMAEED
jgi:2-keto-4-pentenoate hydratase/2-oxohepta-3-ene-1,7-dioic acid hydratase in catechol pathway